MSCQKCESKRVASVQSHGRDCQNVEIGNKEHDGYLPRDFGIGGGDDMHFSYCLNCGQIQGKFPLPITELESSELEYTDDELARIEMDNELARIEDETNDYLKR